MQEIPLEQVPSQRFQIVLENQDCDIEILTRSTGLFLNISVDGEFLRQGAYIVSGAPCFRKKSRFAGSLIMVDTLGEAEPQYTGFGDRWKFLYLTEEETANLFPEY